MYMYVCMYIYIYIYIKVVERSYAGSVGTPWGGGHFAALRRSRESADCEFEGNPGVCEKHNNDNNNNNDNNDNTDNNNK